MNIFHEAWSSLSSVSRHIIVYFLVIAFLHYFFIRWYRRHLKLEKQLSKMLKLREAALNINQGLLESEQLEPLLDNIVQTATSVLGNDCMGTIMMQVEGKMVVKAQVGFDLSIFHDLRLSIEETLLYQYAGGDLSKAAIMHAERDWSKEDPYLKGVASMISAPITDRGNLIASLSIYSKEANAFGLEDLITAEYLSEQVKGVLKKHELFSNTLKEAMFDSLTGLFNRRHGLSVIRDHLNRRGSQEKDFVLIMMDMDNLKPVNDHFGHDAGDNMIETFAAALTSSFKNAICICRYGGDEFVVLLEVGTADKEAHLEHCLKQLSHYTERYPLCFAEATIRLAYSHGVCRASEVEHQWERMIQVADQRMYRVKQHRKVVD